MARRLLSCRCSGPADLPALALWCQRFTPLTAPDPPDGVLLDITGCAHLFGGETGLMAALTIRLPGTRMAVANTAAAAWGLARFGTAENEDILPCLWRHCGWRAAPSANCAALACGRWQS
jgi:protein ImuB